MRPPLPHSYWVEPGLLLAGEHPHGGGEDATRERLALLESAGVRIFIDLTQAGEMPSYEGLLSGGMLYQNLPIPDHSVPAAATRMREIQHVLAQAMASKVPAYVHCRAGIGRTGIAIGCYLREQGMAPQEALAHLNELWKQNARALSWPWIPETEEQEHYILDWQGARVAVPVGAASPTQRYRGSLVGLAVGDIGGAPPPDGEQGWSDDTGMALCVAESLLARGGFDGRDQVERQRAWVKDPAAQGAAPSAAPRPAVQAVLARALWNRSAVLGSHDPAQADAALLARCVPAALFAGGRVEETVALAADITRVIQQARLPVDTCRLYAAMVAVALAGGSHGDVLGAADAVRDVPLCPELQQLAASWKADNAADRGAPRRGLPGALDRIARVFAAGHDFDSGLAVLLEGATADRDALGAAWGALAGAFHGEAAIAQAGRERVAGLARVARLAEQLQAQGSHAHAPAG